MLLRSVNSPLVSYSWTGWTERNCSCFRTEVIKQSYIEWFLEIHELLYVIKLVRKLFADKFNGTLFRLIVELERTQSIPLIPFLYILILLLPFLFPFIFHFLLLLLLIINLVYLLYFCLSLIIFPNDLIEYLIMHFILFASALNQSTDLLLTFYSVVSISILSILKHV